MRRTKKPRRVCGRTAAATAASARAVDEGTDPASSPAERTPVHTAAAPVPPRPFAYSWASPPSVMLGLCVEYVPTLERLATVERVCATWRRLSQQGVGWGHSLDLLALPPQATWADADALLGRRLQSARLQRLLCRSALWSEEARAPAAAASGAAALVVVEAAKDADGWWREDAEGGLPTAVQSAALRAFPNCVTLALATAIELDYRRISSSGAYPTMLFEDVVRDLQPLFPRLQCVDVLVDDEPRALAAQLAHAPSATALGAANVETALAPLMAAHALLPSYRTERRVMLPRMPHVRHLRLAGRSTRFPVENGASGEESRALHTAPLFYLPTDLSALESLQTFGAANFTTYSYSQRVRFPQLTHLAVHSPVNSEMLRHVVDRAAASLQSLVRSCGYISAGTAYISPHCSSLRTLHVWMEADGSEVDAAAELHTRLGALPSLEVAGLYSCAPCVLPSLETLATSYAGARALKRLVVVDIASGAKGCWQYTPLGSEAGARFHYYGAPRSDMRVAPPTQAADRAYPLHCETCPSKRAQRLRYPI